MFRNGLLEMLFENSCRTGKFSRLNNMLALNIARRDAIIVSYQVSQDQINVVVEDDEQEEWLATATIPPDDRVVGFVRFLRSKGTVEISNFDAYLPRCALDLGVSTRATDEKQAGTHGEGFKVGALVMLRKGYQVRYEASKFYWTFAFGGTNKKHLFCHLTPASASKTTAVDDDGPRTTDAHISKDVTVMIGKVTSKAGKKVEEAEFFDWIRVFLSFEEPQSMVRTSVGDLIFDKELSGRMYLKGLYLGDSASSKSVKHSYNFYDGEINRDRHKMSKP